MLAKAKAGRRNALIAIADVCFLRRYAWGRIEVSSDQADGASKVVVSIQVTGGRWMVFDDAG